MERVIFEDFVLKDFPNAILEQNKMYKNINYPCLQASLDGLDKESNTIIEIKFVNLYGATNWKHEELKWKLPNIYWMQLQLYMAVLDKT